MQTVWRFAFSSLIDVVAVAMMLPLIALFMNEQRVTPGYVGLYAAVPFAALLVNLPLVPLAMRRFGFGRMFGAGLLLSSAGIVMSALSRDYASLCLGAGLVGIGAAYRWSAVEAMIAWSAPIDSLGRVTGFYQTLVAAAYAIGPFLVPLFALTLDSAGYVAIGLAVASWLPVLIGGTAEKVQFATNDTPGGNASWHVFLPLAALGFIGGVFEVGLNVLAPIQAERLGAIATDSAIILTGVIAVASLVMQYPVGRLADRFGIGPMMQILCATLLLSLLAAPLGSGIDAMIWLAAIIWGGAGGAIYTLTMIHVGRSFRGQSLAVSIVIAAYTVGGAIAPALGGLGLGLSTQCGLAWALGPLLLLAWPLARLRPNLSRGDHGDTQ